MSMATDPYLAVLKASYDYGPQSEDEIAIKEDQLLFLIQRVDDDWWKVKIKSDTQDAETPVGLVPAAYVEQAEHTSLVKALYDYEAAAPGELSVQEDEILLAFDAEQDWLLVQSQKEGGKAGFIPANYVEPYAEEEETPAAPQLVVPPPAPRPVSTYVDPADRVASAKVSADGIQTWSVSEVDKKGKKKKGTLGIGNGALFFASESDKTPVQKWKVQDVVDVGIEKAKHIVIEVGGTTPITLHFHTGSKDNVEAIMNKLESSKALAAAQPRPSTDSAASRPSDVGPSTQEPHKPTVHFSDASPEIIPSGDEDEYEEPETPRPSFDNRKHSQEDDADGESGTALYDFTADGSDELSVTEGEQLVILERDGDEWWKCRNTKGAVGVVPASYVELSNASGGAAAQSTAQEEDEDDRAAEQERLQQEEEERLAREREEHEKRKKAQAERRAKEAAAAAAEAEADRKRQTEKDAKARAVAGAKKPASENGANLSQPPAENSRPPPDRTRVWHDRTGQFRVEAAFLGFKDGKLRLHKVNGVIVEVPAEKMSVEDLQFVERLTKKPGSKASDDDIPLALNRPSTSSISNPPRSTPPKKVSNIDWFDFFLSAGCDVDDCTRYSAAFERDKIDETLLPDITEGTMRSLGIREGDIIRITKAIEKRKPTDNLNKPSKATADQIRRDAELARQLQERESGGPTPPAPNLFAGPRGVLKNPQRRGRPQPSKSVPAAVDINAISTASDNLQRTSSPSILTPSSANISSSPVQGPPRSDSTPTPVSGFGDDAWANRPSSTKPTIGTPTPRAPSIPPVSTTSTLVLAPVAPAPVAASPPVVTTASPAPLASTAGPASLAKTNESDIFDQLARLSELRKQTPAVQTPLVQGPPSASPPGVPAGYQAGLGMGSSPAPIAQHLQNLQLNSAPQPPSQLYNGPRGPFAPVPANQSLLQPLIPTQTGFNTFVPTRTTFAPASAPAPMLNVPAVSPFANPTQPSFMMAQPTGVPGFQPLMTQPTGIPGVQPLMSQQTGLPFNGFNPGQSPSPFTPIQPQYTSFNPNLTQSPFNNGMMSPSPVPPLPTTPASATKDTTPANIFAQMRSGAFANENAANTQSPMAPQATGWNQPFQASYMGYQR